MRSNGWALIHVTEFGDGTLKEVIKLKWGRQSEPQPHRTGVLIKRGGDVRGALVQRKGRLRTQRKRPCGSQEEGPQEKPTPPAL